MVRIEQIVILMIKEIYLVRPMKLQHPRLGIFSKKELATFASFVSYLKQVLFAQN